MTKRATPRTAISSAAEEATPKSPQRISLTALGYAAHQDKPTTTPFKLPKPAPGVVPSTALAMDSDPGLAALYGHARLVSNGRPDRRANQGRCRLYGRGGLDHSRQGDSNSDADDLNMCPICDVVRQLGLNLALLSDKLLNTALGGDPNETLSRRTARARDAGSKTAAIMCAALTSVWRLFGSNVDHCTWSEEQGSIGAEVWHWSNK